MVEDNPNQIELEEMIAFSKKYNIYIYIWIFNSRKNDQ